MADSIDLTPGSDDWKKWRKLCTESVPGKFSSLYFLTAYVLKKREVVPMTLKAHYGMMLFAEGATGIKEIDDARIKLILVPRGMGKSTLITKALPIHRTLQNRNYATGIANEISDLAKTFLGDIKAEYESNELLQTLFPEIIPDFNNTTWTAEEIIINRDQKNATSPTIKAIGSKSTPTGVHMNEWILDDILSKNAAEAARRGSTEEIEAVNRFISRLQPLLKNPTRDPVTVVGTRWWEGDSYEFIEEFWGKGEDRTIYNWTLKLPAERFTWDEGEVNRPAETQHIKLFRRGDVAIFCRPAIDENGRSIFPERYTEDELQAMQEQDPVFFAGQYLLQPTAGGASIFEKDWLKEYTVEGSHIRFFNDEIARFESVPISSLSCLLSVDPAFSKKSSAARTAIPVIGTDGKRLLLLEDFAERLDSEDEIAAKVVEFYFRYPIKKIFVETIVAQVAIANAIRRRFREEGLGEPPLEELRSHSVSNKRMRIYGMEHYFKRGLFFIQKIHTRFLQEYLSFPRALLRDILDAISFQQDEWEKVFKMTHRAGGTEHEEIRAADARAAERARSVWGRRGRRRR